VSDDEAPRVIMGVGREQAGCDTPTHLRVRTGALVRIVTTFGRHVDEKRKRLVCGYAKRGRVLSGWESGGRRLL
jgi:hypothetical protein